MPELIESDVHYWLPDGLEARPKTALQLLKAARAIVREEGRWTKTTDFRPSGTPPEQKSPFCGDWQVCARGALRVTAFGVKKSVIQGWWRQPNASHVASTIGYKEQIRRENIYARAERALSDAARSLRPGTYNIVDLNDSNKTTHADVMNAFDLAIEDEERRESEERARRGGYNHHGLKFMPYVPAGFEGEPTNVVDVLRRGREVLAEEERWMRDSYFSNRHPHRNPDDAFCNSWRVCAEGAVGVVSIGARRSGTAWLFDPDFRRSPARQDLRSLYNQATEYLRLAGYEITGVSKMAANRYNDHVFETRAEVLAWFDKAIELAEASLTEEKQADAG